MRSLNNIGISIVLLWIIGIYCCSSPTSASTSVNKMAGGSVRIETITHEGCKFIVTIYELNGVSTIHSPTCSNPNHHNCL